MNPTNTQVNSNPGWIAELFDPDRTTVRSDDLQNLLDAPAELCDVLTQHVELSGHAPASTVDVICSTFRELFTWWGAHSVHELNPSGWADFIARGSDPYERALCCQTLHQLLDLLGVPSPHHAPLPDPAVVPVHVLPPASTITPRQRRKPTRKLAPLELGVARHAVLPLFKGTTVTFDRHCPPPRDQFVAAVVLGAAGCLLCDSELAALHVTHIERVGESFLVADNARAVFPRPVMLDEWTAARLTDLLAYDLAAAAEDDVLMAKTSDRYCNDRFALPLLYGGRRAATSTSATNTMNAKINNVLKRTGLARAGLTPLSVRLAGADEAIANGATEASVAAQLDFYCRRRPDVEQLASFLDQ